jgi:ATP-binding cassette subfamily F protein 3
VIRLTGLHKSFGARYLFRDASMYAGARDRVAIVGPNGSGKTTLFEMIVGEQLPDEGRIDVPKDVVIGFLRQETDDLRGRSVLEEVLTAGSEVTDAAHRLAILEMEMAEASDEDRTVLVDEYGRLQARFSAIGGYAIESEARKILAGLGFSDDDVERRTETLSGGWLMRIALAKLLLAGPDVLMLDEPTNHLDVESVEWLERFLRSYEGAILLISHDRDFINNFATKVVEIEATKLVTYTGNYEDFVRQRETIALQRAAEAKTQERKVAATQEFIDRFRYKATKAKQVQSRVKALEKMERVTASAPGPRVMKLKFPAPPRAGRVVLELDDVAFGYDDRLVYEQLNLAIERHHKVALVGPNGAGKTTLLKLVAGVLDPRAGERKVGHNTSIGYFAQHQVEALDPGNRIIQEFDRAIPAGTQVKARDLLGRFLFSGDDIDKRVSVLSGGERTRLALAKILVSPVNLLCLDEPTNHLDIQSRDALEEALTDYAGALVLITHDRHLIRNIADRIVEVVAGRVTVFDGDYDYYLSKRDHEANALSIAPADPERQPTSAKDRRRAAAQVRAQTADLRRKIARIENELEEVGTQLTQLSATLADPDVYSSGADVRELVRAYEKAKARTEKLERMWEQAARSLEAAEA